MNRSFEPSDSVISVDNVVRTFDHGSVRAVDGVSLVVSPGEIVGLLGPNGAGKTTLLRMCCTLLVPDSGAITINGVDAVAFPRDARQYLGVATGGELGFYPRATVRDNLLFFADILSLGNRRHAEVEWALDRVRLGDRALTRVNALSHGMKQRLHLARAMMGRPRLLLLDEITSGLDPEVSAEIRELIRELARSGVAVLLTSHAMAEIEDLADRLAVISEGRLIVEGNVADVAAAAGVGWVSDFTAKGMTASMRASIELLSPISIDAVTLDGAARVRVMWPVSAGGSMAVKLRAALLQNGALPPDYVDRPATLEEAYLALIDSQSHRRRQ